VKMHCTHRSWEYRPLKEMNQLKGDLLNERTALGRVTVEMISLLACQAYAAGDWIHPIAVGDHGCYNS
jgi:hypothetical protein